MVAPKRALTSSVFWSTRALAIALAIAAASSGLPEVALMLISEVPWMLPATIRLESACPPPRRSPGRPRSRQPGSEGGGAARLQRSSRQACPPHASPFRVAQAEHRGNGEDHDLEVERQRARIDVAAVQAHHLAGRKPVPAHYLPEAGHTRAHREPLEMPVGVVVQLVGDPGA